MPNSTVTTISSVIQVNDVNDVQVTGIEADDDGFVREVRIYGTSDLSANQMLALTVRIKSATRANLEVTTPNVNF